MGLYDELICDYPLPDGWDCRGHVFQTKDTPIQYLARFMLRADGVLLDPEEEPVPYHGALTFYTGNVCGFGPDGYTTHDDQPAWHAVYTALFDHGRLLKLEGRHGPDRSMHQRPHLTQAAWEAVHPLWGRTARQEESDADL